MGDNLRNEISEDQGVVHLRFTVMQHKKKDLSHLISRVIGMSIEVMFRLNR